MASPCQITALSTTVENTGNFLKCLFPTHSAIARKFDPTQYDYDDFGIRDSKRPKDQDSVLM